MTAPLEPRPWQGTVYRHLPVNSPYGPLDTRFAARSRESRWNHAGEPTLEFAGSELQVERELARRIERDRAGQLAAHVQPRQVFAVELRLERVFDLTVRATLLALGIEGAPLCFLDRRLARATAGFLRYTRQADGLLAPSLATAHDLTAWRLLIFLDRPETLEGAVRHVSARGTFQVEAAPPAASHA